LLKKKISSSRAISGLTFLKEYKIRTPTLTIIPKKIFGPKLTFIIKYLFLIDHKIKLTKKSITKYV